MSLSKYKVAILTSSDKGAKGERVDESGPLIREIMTNNGFDVFNAIILPDEQELLSQQMIDWADSGEISLILTTGGTGFSPRDCMPEATLAIIERLVPGIPEAIRMESLTITNRAMLSRATAGIRGRTLIINLPGSKKAVGEALDIILPVLEHGLDILTNNASDCARES